DVCSSDLIDLHGHRFAVFHGRFELPGLDCFNRLLIQPQAQTSCHTNISRSAIWPYDQPQNASPLVLRLTCFFRVLRIGLEDDSRGAHSTTHVEESPANSTASALAYTRPRAH